MMLISLLLLLYLSECTPVLVIEFLRHGARAPISKNPFFPYINWKIPGEPTPVGERQHYLLGRLRRLQYIENNNFLPKLYNPSFIYARSTDTRRTIMSLQSYLLGLYPEGLSELRENQITQAKEFLLPQINLTIDENIIKALGNKSSPYNIPVPHFEIKKTDDDHLLLFSNCPDRKSVE